LTNEEQERRGIRILAERIIDDIYKSLARMEDPKKIKADIIGRYSINVRADDLKRFENYVGSLVDERVKRVGDFREEYKKERKEIGQKVRGNKISVDEAKRRIREARSRILKKHLGGESDIYSSEVEENIARWKEKEERRKEEEKYEDKIKDKILGHGLPFFKGGVEAKVGADFDKLPMHARRDAWTEWYRQEMENLRAAYQKGDINEEEFRKNSDDLKKYVKKEMGFGPRWSWGHRKLITEGYGQYIKSAIYPLGFILIGVIVSATTGSWLFFVGFLGIAAYLLFPDPKDIEAKEEEKRVSFGTPLTIVPGHSKSSTHNGIAFMKSAGKVTAIIGFALGFKGLGDVFNTMFILTAVLGYFLLKVEYENSADFIESILRFFLGMILIPWIFNDIFNSLVLAGIAFAFFAVPPLPSEGMKDIGKVLSRGLSGATAYYEMADKFIFGSIMILVLIGSGSLGFMGISPAAGWGLTGTLQYTFIYFWLVCGVAGFFSPARERPVTGGIMLGAATVIYGIGPGSQAVGSGLLGQWWPTVHNTFTSITEPMSNLMGTIGNTFGQGFLLLTNPVGYATQLMNGTYAENPVGPTGSYGVDITEFSITSIFPEQPYVVTAILENKGAFKAGNVSMSIMAAGGDRFATEGTSRARSVQPKESKYLSLYDLYDLYGRKQMFMDIDNLGFKEGSACNYLTDDKKECFQLYGVGISDSQARDGNDLDRLMVWQAAFQSSGINCSTIAGISLRKRYIPIAAKVTYDYQSDSKVEVEFISKAEWERLAQAGQLDSGFRFIQSQYTSAPVKFPIGTAGLKNPILEDQQFHISMMLDSAFEKDSHIDRVKKVNLTYPADWELRGGDWKSACTPEPIGHDEDKEGGIEYVEWEPNIGGPKTLVCYFEPLNTRQDALGGAPSKTYVVTAHADYTFSRWKYRDTEIKFGGFCCPDRPGCTENCRSEDCLDGQYCLNNACVYAPPEEDGGTAQPSLGDADFCEKKVKGELTQYGINNEPCSIGMGGCSSSYCGGPHYDCNTEDQKIYDTVCMDIDGVTVDMCCSEEFSEKQCKALYDLWIQKKARLTDAEVKNICDDVSLKT
jgi:hypothetical protein